ncbi:hypothetical protein [Sulfurovum mangrovi]|uniref:hypothetical protein n=1 Tax=Sulfurovum mangrovi TaxID=2893889 RepID=UPI001E2BB3DE|nr:hypothetical protein [Sulfurovum mangrovi]UFH58074.1 hypothetical protein LN246_06890 [Sulfurovum mangrovi]
MISRKSTALGEIVNFSELSLVIRYCNILDSNYRCYNPTMTLLAYENRLTLTMDELRRLPLHRVDAESSRLKEAFEIAYKHDIFRVVDLPDFEQGDARFKLFSALTRYSGSLVFLGIQILAANNIMNANDFSLKQEYFNKRCGIAINHLRAPVTVVSAQENEDGFRLTGTLTWASGYGIFDTLLVGFHCAGAEYVAVVPFTEAEGFKIGDPAESFVGESMATVDIALDNFLVPADHIVASFPLGSYSAAKSISKTVHIAIYSLGLGAIEQLKDETVKKDAAMKLEAIKDAFMETQNGEIMDRLRIELFRLVQDIITTGMVLVGGKFVLSIETLQRYYRELIMFNSNGLNDTIKGLFKEKFLSS